MDPVTEKLVQLVLNGHIVVADNAEAKAAKSALRVAYDAAVSRATPAAPATPAQ
jgi:hypothetical protein